MPRTLSTLAILAGLTVGVVSGHFSFPLIARAIGLQRPADVSYIAICGKILSVDPGTKTMTLMAGNPYTPGREAPLSVKLIRSTKMIVRTENASTSNSFTLSSNEFARLAPGTRVKVYVQRAQGPLMGHTVLINSANPL